MEFSQDQVRALAAIEDWLSSSTNQVLCMGGLAGTGKSFLVSHIVGSRRGTRVCAFTGKAAYVLRSKGVTSASTIHSLIYAPTEACKISGRSIADCGICKPICKHTELDFVLVPELDAKLIVVDEASMVSFDLYRDLLSFGKKVLFVGDHGQLEPIGRNPMLMKNPQIRLEQIHRQAEGSPIIQFAHHVRSGRRPISFGEQAQVISTASAPRNVHEFDAVLCGKNSTRVAINERIRRDRGFAGDLPCVGETVICLRNDKIHKVFNGLIAKVQAVEESADGDGMLLTVVDPVGDVYPRMPFVPEQFGLEKTMEAGPRKTLWDFGYALTAHKSQGDQFNRVCVLEWIHREWGVERWRYTTATRAVEELVYCVNPGRS